jgi:hypothetical protein
MRAERLELVDQHPDPDHFLCKNLGDRNVWQPLRPQRKVSYTFVVPLYFSLRVHGRITASQRWQSTVSVA